MNDNDFSKIVEDIESELAKMDETEDARMKRLCADKPWDGHDAEARASIDGVEVDAARLFNSNPGGTARQEGEVVEYEYNGPSRSVLPRDSVYAVATDKPVAVAVAAGRVGAQLVDVPNIPDGLGPISVLHLMPDMPGEMMRKRVGEKRYQLWLKTQEGEARTSAQLMARNVRMQEEQNRPRVRNAAVSEPPRPSFWVRTKTFFKNLFGRKS